MFFVDFMFAVKHHHQKQARTPQEPIDRIVSMPASEQQKSIVLHP
jgi:hypothetical protein